MRIGISAFSIPNHNIWSNGLGQNLLFLVQALRNVPDVTDVLLIDVGSGDGLGPQVDLERFGTRMVTTQDATDMVDLVIEFAGAISVPWLQLQRARGVKVVYHCVGQPHASLMESTVFNRQGFFLDPERFDVIWLLAKDAVHAPMMRTIYRCQTHVAPYLWSPSFLDDRIKTVASQGYTYGFQPIDQKMGWKVAMFEPNLSPVKSNLIPMLIVDSCKRQHPERINMMYTLNMEHLVQHQTLLHFANSLDVVKAGQAVFTGRHDIAGFMSQYGVNAIVSHQWQNDQNYSYLDALYGNYPLIHNSPWLKDAGYYYPEFDVEKGAACLNEAFDNHAYQLSSYRARSEAMFKQVDPHNPVNVQGYADLLKQLGVRHSSEAGA